MVGFEIWYFVIVLFLKDISESQKKKKYLNCCKSQLLKNIRLLNVSEHKVTSLSIMEDEGNKDSFLESRFCFHSVDVSIVSLSIYH